MKKIVFMLGMFLCGHSLFAQTIEGKVTDASGNPLSGATISSNGKNIASTDAGGHFSIACSHAGTVTISFVGYENLKRTVACNDKLTLVLTAADNTLGNVEISTTTARNKSLLYQPASITKLNSTELKRNTGLFLDDAINGNVPGVTMQRRSVSGGQQFNIRGYGNGTRGTRGVSSNFDGQGYKVYLNGIPVTDAEGITTMDDIDFGSIGNVEVTKGPAGTLYGLAIAGAVNLKTVKPDAGQTTIGQDIMLGNYGLKRFTTHFATSNDRSSILLNYGRQHSDGFSVHNESHKDFVNLVTDFHPNLKQSFSGYFGFSDSYDQRLGELTLTQYANKDYSGNIDYIKRDGHSHVTSFRTGMGHTYEFNKHVSNTSSIFFTGFNSDVSSAAGWTDKTSINYGFRSSFETKFELADGVSLTGITGAEAQRQIAQTVGYNMKQNPNDLSSTWVMGNPYWVINATTSNIDYVTSTASLFSEWTLALPADFSVTAGIGSSNQLITLNDRLNPMTATKPSRFDTTYKNMVSPHFALNKVFSKELSVYASYSKGYKAPTSSYFFITTPAVTTPATPATGRVNSVLKPEYGNQFELGSKGNLFHDRLNYQLAFFHTKFSNKMTTVAVQLNSTTTAYTYVVNGGDQDHKGLEGTLRFVAYKSGNQFFSSVTPFFNFAYSDFTYGSNFKYQTGTTTSNITTVDYSNQAVAGVPKWTANFGTDFRTKPGLYGNFIWMYRDGVPITSDGVNRSTSYNLLNFKLGYERDLSKHVNLDLSFGVNNVTGVQYPIMIFANQLPDAYLPAPLKDVVFGGLNLKYKF